jgi:saccharopine dehydrogenase-like NADP-dependent oxidoreductase
MNVTVFGATGAIGSLTVDELLANGHTVTVYARNPSKIPAGWGDRVAVIIGELSDADAIDQAVTGAEAVVSTLGPSLDRKATEMPLIEGTRHILDACSSRSSASPPSDRACTRRLASNHKEPTMTIAILAPSGSSAATPSPRCSSRNRVFSRAS